MHITKLVKVESNQDWNCQRAIAIIKKRLFRSEMTGISRILLKDFGFQLVTESTNLNSLSRLSLSILQGIYKSGMCAAVGRERGSCGLYVARTVEKLEGAQ